MISSSPTRSRASDETLAHHARQGGRCEALRFCNIENGIEIVSIADIPSGTGLGSSSCYLVGLLNALHTLTQSPGAPETLAQEACHIELERLRKPIGKQDQYMAAFGGLTNLEIAKK